MQSDKYLWWLLGALIVATLTAALWPLIGRL
jgi:hypothetical protein